MRRNVSGLKALILVGVIQWLGTVGLYLTSTPIVFAKSCVQVPESTSDAARTKIIPTDAGILRIMRQQGSSDEFPKGIHVQYLGSATVGATKYHVVYTRLWWNNGTRETDRLVFFSEEWQYLGDYGHLLHPPNWICGNVLYWPYSAKFGNKLVFDKNGLPDKIWLDGEIYGFDNSKSSGGKHD